MNLLPFFDSEWSKIFILEEKANVKTRRDLSLNIKPKQLLSSHQSVVPQSAVRSLNECVACGVRLKRYLLLMAIWEHGNDPRMQGTVRQGEIVMIITLSLLRAVFLRPAEAALHRKNESKRNQSFLPDRKMGIHISECVPQMRAFRAHPRSSSMGRAWLRRND